MSWWIFRILVRKVTEGSRKIVDIINLVFGAGYVNVETVLFSGKFDAGDFSLEDEPSGKGR